MRRQQWIAMLAKLVAPMDATTAAKALADMLPMFGDVPDGAFSAGSLNAVAVAAKRVPSYAELRELLERWWQENRNDQISTDHDSVMSERDAWVRNWQRHADGDWGRGKDGMPHTGDGAQLRRDLARVRKFQSGACDRLLAADPRAKRIASQAGWLKPTGASA